MSKNKLVIETASPRTPGTYKRAKNSRGLTTFADSAHHSDERSDLAAMLCAPGPHILALSAALAVSFVGGLVLHCSQVNDPVYTVLFGASIALLAMAAAVAVYASIYHCYVVKDADQARLSCLPSPCMVRRLRPASSCLPV